MPKLLPGRSATMYGAYRFAPAFPSSMLNNVHCAKQILAQLAHFIERMVQYRHGCHADQGTENLSQCIAPPFCTSYAAVALPELSLSILTELLPMY